MEGYNVVVAVARGLEDTGRSIALDVMATSRLDAAIIAEGFVNYGLGANEYAHARTVNPIATHNRPGPARAMAA